MVNQQHFMKSSELHRQIFYTLDLSGKSVVEIGVGHGELTSLILEYPVSSVTGYEIDESLVSEIYDERFSLIVEDAQTVKEEWAYDWLISNPPYDLLPWMREVVFPQVKDILVMVPERDLQIMKNDFVVMGSLEGIDFEPVSTGRHYVLRKIPR